MRCADCPIGHMDADAKSLKSREMFDCEDSVVISFRNKTVEPKNFFYYIPSF